MKLIATILTAAIFACTAAAQSNPVGEFAARVAEYRVTFDYTYVMSNPKLKVHGGGNVIAQKDCYCLEGNGLKVWCDGSSVWTMDEEAEEVVIEPAESVGGLTVNPIHIVMNVDKIFTWDSGTAAKFDGRQCTVYSLSPVVETDFEDVKFYMSGDNLTGVTLDTDEAALSFTISNIEFHPFGDNSAFTPGTFSSDCIITDLR